MMGMTDRCDEHRFDKQAFWFEKQAIVDLRRGNGSVLGVSEEAVLNLSRTEAAEKAKVDRYLAETLTILRELAAERMAHKERSRKKASILEEIRAILRTA